MITVMGATGNTGKKIAEGLLEARQQVRAIGRSEVKLAALRDAGVEALVGDSSDPDFLTSAFRGAEAVYTLLPTDPRAADYPARQRQEGEAIVSAVRESGVKHVVALSCIGAELSEGTGMIKGLHAQEERLKSLTGVNLLFPHPVPFFENFYETLKVIKSEGIVADSVEADLAIPMIASLDIAGAAVQALDARDWSGVVVKELIGQRDLSYREATSILGERIGLPDLEYVQLPYADMANVLVQAGLSGSFAGLYVEMTRAFNEGIVQPLHGRTPENTTPTSFEEFANELAHAYATM